MNKSRIIATFLFITTRMLLSQEIPITQYNFDPFNINPALISSEESLRFIAFQQSMNFSNQPVSSMVNASLLAPVWHGNDFRVSMGTRYTHEGFQENHQKQHGASAGIGLGYDKGKHHWYMGSSITYNRLTTDFTNLRTPSQWNNLSGFDPSIPTDDPTIGQDDFHSIKTDYGIYYSYQKGNRTLFETGTAAEVYRGNKNIYPRIFANLQIFRSGNFTTHTEFLYIQNQRYFNGGIRVGYHFKEEDYISLTFRKQYQGAHSAILQLKTGNYTLGFSYDFPGNTSQEIPQFHKTGFALSLTIPRKKVESLSETNTGHMPKTVAIDFRKREAKPEGKAVNSEFSPSDAAKKSTFSLTTGFQSIEFEFNNYRIAEKYFPRLDSIASLLVRENSIQLILVGHSDNIGTEKQNMAMSRLRAVAVRKYLINKGIPENRMFEIYKGDTDPLRSNGSEVGRAANRRVEFMFFDE